MGSGETAPAMVKTHRAILASCPDGPALMLDTPYAFQVNADDLTNRTVRYFRESVGHQIQAVSWRRRDAADADQALAKLSQAAWLFAGPGSPTYALEQWRDAGIEAAIGDVLSRGGTVVFGSAAAVTAGRWALPVYEIYKAGAELHWVEGLDLFGKWAGIDVAVIPHYDNAEGGTYDTRFCYLGEDRLAEMESMIGDSAAVLGVDEHTGVVIDLRAEEVHVHGAGTMSLRRHGVTETFGAGSAMSLDELRGVVKGGRRPHGVNSRTASAGDAESQQPSGTPSLASDVAEIRTRFDAAIASADVDEAVGSILALEETIQSWSSDTLQSDLPDRARRELRAMVVRLGELARTGVDSPSEVLAPVVEAVLKVRAAARGRGDYQISDALRDALTEGGVTVEDASDGARWIAADMT
jgi:cyanophycinase-like exopeptidase